MDGLILAPLSWLVAALTLFLIIYGAIRLALKHDRRSRGL
jgi:hypothetical protein